MIIDLYFPACISKLIPAVFTGFWAQSQENKVRIEVQNRRKILLKSWMLPWIRAKIISLHSRLAKTMPALCMIMVRLTRDSPWSWKTYLTWINGDVSQSM